MLKLWVPDSTNDSIVLIAVVGSPEEHKRILVDALQFLHKDVDRVSADGERCASCSIIKVLELGTAMGRRIAGCLSKDRADGLARKVEENVVVFERCFKELNRIDAVATVFDNLASSLGQSSHARSNELGRAIASVRQARRIDRSGNKHNGMVHVRVLLTPTLKLFADVVAIIVRQLLS